MVISTHARPYKFITDHNNHEGKEFLSEQVESPSFLQIRMRLLSMELNIEKRIQEGSKKSSVENRRVRTSQEQVDVSKIVLQITKIVL